MVFLCNNLFKDNKFIIFMSIIEKVLTSEEKNKFAIMKSRLDSSLIDNLSDAEFLQLHQELMKEYQDKDGWFANGQTYSCDFCHDKNNPIKSPTEMARYYGRTVHSSCFKEMWKDERKFASPLDIRYWDRLARILN